MLGLGPTTPSILGLYRAYIRIMEKKIETTI